jgi:putative peptidoglycan lipid II flippase
MKTIVNYNIGIFEKICYIKVSHAIHPLAENYKKPEEIRLLMSRLTRTSLMLAVFIALDKGLGILRAVFIGRQFGLTSHIDAFNAANNMPDLLIALISGGALAVAFIPILADVLAKEGRKQAWELFSRIANQAFLVTSLLAVVTAILAETLVRYWIAPGFTQEQQKLAAELMRLDLVATLIFSISGLIMAGLQANQHFLLPAMASPLYNLGQIFGVFILAPAKSFVVAGIALPAYGLGVHGLVYGVILGALLHLCIQIPGLIMYGFKWQPSLGLKDAAVQKVLRLFGPRLVTMIFIQLTFIFRDRLASFLPEGSVTALTVGYMVQQVPETLIGTAIGIAILPTLSELASRQDWENFRATIERAVQVLLGLTIPISIVLTIGLHPLLGVVFNFGAAGTDLVMWTTRGFLVGLAGQSLLEVANRAFYARQNAWMPLLGSLLNIVIYTILGSLLFRPFGAPGISLTDSVAFTTQAVVILLVLNGRLPDRIRAGRTVGRALLAALVGGLVSLGIFTLLSGKISPVIVGGASICLGGLALLPLIWRELRLLLHL